MLALITPLVIVMVELSGCTMPSVFEVAIGNLATGAVPLAIADAFRLFRLAPLPTKTPQISLAALVNVSARVSLVKTSAARDEEIHCGMGFVEFCAAVEIQTGIGLVAAVIHDEMGLVLRPNVQLPAAFVTAVNGDVTPR